MGKRSECMEGEELQRLQPEGNDLEERKEYFSMKNDDQQW